MANEMRILFVSGEVAPFTKKSETAQLVRTLPERLHETGDYQTRIMMPRYGIVSERRNRLHEVIRLSGTEIPIGPDKEILKVKVASIPGIRLQVYFMDNNHFFKRKGIFADKQGKVFADNAERALFFGRSVIETTRNLGWGPDIVHCFGWMSGFVPMLLRTEFANDPLFEETRLLFTPETPPLASPLTDSFVEAFGLPATEAVIGHDPIEIGAAFADLVVYPPSMAPEGDAHQFEEDPETMTNQAIALYEQASNIVPA